MTAPVLDTERLAAGLAQLERDRAQLAGLAITSAEMATACGQILIEALKQHDALQAERDRVVMPIHAAYKNASETYAPHLKASKACIDALKSAIGAWELAEKKRKAEAFQIAQAATVVSVIADTADSAAQAGQVMTAALEVAAAPTGLGKGTAAAGVGTRFMWAVKRIDNPDPRRSMLPSEYWSPNMQAIETEADRQRAEGTVTDDSPPVIPGVVFELVASVMGRRKAGT